MVDTPRDLAMAINKYDEVGLKKTANLSNNINEIFMQGNEI